MSFDSLVFIYNGHWSIQGGITYLSELTRGMESCALCDITHGLVRKKGQWKECEAQISTPIESLYLNQLEDPHKQAAGEEYPCILGRSGNNYKKLLGPLELKECEGDPEALKRLIDVVLLSQSKSS